MGAIPCRPRTSRFVEPWQFDEHQFQLIVEQAAILILQGDPLDCGVCALQPVVEKGDDIRW